MKSPLKITMICESRLPALKYGGTERVVEWLAREFIARGHGISVICKPGSHIPGARMIYAHKPAEVAALVPQDTDIIHSHGWYLRDHAKPQLKTCHGNANIVDDSNWSFVSLSHAERFGRKTYVHNAMPRGEAYFSSVKSSRYLFFSRINRPGKNITRAIQLANKFDLELDIAGGHRWELLTRSVVCKEGAFFSSLHRRFHFHGKLGGWPKNELFANARALLFPIRWEEPFGIVTIEALFAGTPVIATPRGAMPEIIGPEVGFLCESDEEFAAALENVGRIDPQICRDYALEHFAMEKAADQYLALYERVIAGEVLP